MPTDEGGGQTPDRVRPGARMSETIMELIGASLREVNEDLRNPALDNPSVNTVLYGGRGNLDSISLVRFLVDLEDRLSATLGKPLVLGDDRAMSQARSPFRTVGSLVAYIEELL
jgi:acyl carrier protein